MISDLDIVRALRGQVPLGEEYPLLGVAINSVHIRASTRK